MRIIKQLIYQFKTWIYVQRVRFFDSERLINELKMSQLENKQKQDLINELMVKLTPQKDYKGYDNREDGLVLNPIWQVSVKRNNQTITAMPLIYFIHSHLKTYGFDPDNKLRKFNLPSERTKVILSMEVGKDVRFPMYIKGDKLPEGERLYNLDPSTGEIETSEGVFKKEEKL